MIFIKNLTEFHQISPKNLQNLTDICQQLMACMSVCAKFYGYNIINVPLYMCSFHLSMQMVSVAGALLCYKDYMFKMCYYVLTCHNLHGLADITEAIL